MIQHELLRDQGILIITPQGPLEQKDFATLAREVDPYIQEKGKLNGLMIHVKSFPGWHDFASLVSHFKFVKGHHQHIAKVAAVTDSGFLSILPPIAKHFVRAEVRHFDYNDKEKALKWLSPARRSSHGSPVDFHAAERVRRGSAHPGYEGSIRANHLRPGPRPSPG